MVSQLLYHWTHKRNLPSIAASGLDPTYSQGKKQEVWACTARHVAWALGHVSHRHGELPDEMVLLEIRVGKTPTYRSPFKGVYTCRTGYAPDQIASVRRGILAKPLPLPKVRNADVS